MNGSSPGVSFPEQISVTCYEAEIPSFIEAEMDRLYQNVFSSLDQLRTHGRLSDKISTYVARSKSDKIVAIFLFQRDGATVRVINEGMEIGSVAVTRFARTIFDAYSAVSVIAFHAVRTAIGGIPFPHQRFNCSEDFVLTLPGTAAEYLAGLGASTRSYIKRYLNRARRVFSSFLYQVVEKEEVSEQLVHDIVHMNKARMQGKGKVPGIDNDETGRLFRLAQLRGLTGVVMIDGRPCAGVITYRSGMNYFMEVVAHDPAYDDYRLGTLCCYLTICECIARGGKEFHFLWGRNDYKSRLGGVRRDLDDLVVYRSPAQWRRNCRLVLRTSFHGRLRQAKLWLGKNDPHHRPVLEAIVRKVRALKR